MSYLVHNKADNYARFVQLCLAGSCFAVKREVRVNRQDLVQPPHQTDQWLQKSSGVKLAALWVQALFAGEMLPGAAFSPVWDPKEANPFC